MAGLIGVEALRGFKDFVEATKDLSHELTQLQKQGVSGDNYQAAIRESQRVTERVRGLTQTQALEIYGNAYSMFGPQEALRMTEPLSRFAVNAANTSGGEVNIKQVQQMLRAADLMNQFNDATGHLDVNRLQNFLDVGSKVMSVTHGAVTPQTWLGLAQQGGPALTHLTDQGLITEGIIAQYMGGPRAGTAMMSAYQQMVGGTMYKRTAEALEEAGILKPGEWSAQGGHVTLSQEASKRLGTMLGGDPLEFAENILTQMAEGPLHITDPDQQSNMLFRIFGRQTTQRMMSDLIRNRNQIKGERDRTLGALGAGAGYDTAQDMDVEQNLNNIGAAWHNLLLAVAGPDGLMRPSFRYLLVVLSASPPWGWSAARLLCSLAR
jgi:hypothetical protein